MLRSGPRLAARLFTVAGEPASPESLVRGYVADADRESGAPYLPPVAPDTGKTVAVIGGVGLAVLFNQSKWASLSIYPYAVILQVTPVVAIAPLIFIYVDSKIAGMLLCAWIVA